MESMLYPFHMSKTLNFGGKFLKLLNYHLPMQLGPSLSVWTDGRTDVMKFVTPFGNIANTSKL